MSYMNFYVGNEDQASKYPNGIFLTQDTHKIFYNGDAYGGEEVDLSNYTTKDDLNSRLTYYISTSGGYVYGDLTTNAGHGFIANGLRYTEEGIYLNSNFYLKPSSTVVDPNQIYSVYLIRNNGRNIEFIWDSDGANGFYISVYTSSSHVYIKNTGIEINQTKYTSTGVTISGKTTSDLLNAGGSTTSISDLVTQITASIVDNAPTTLDTLNELAAALGDDPNFATTIANQLANKADKTVATTDTDGLMSAEDKNFLDRLVSIALSYDDGDRGILSGGSPSYISSSNSLEILLPRVQKTGPEVWAKNYSNIVIPAATVSKIGLMSPSDKTKLDGITPDNYVTLDGDQTISGGKTFGNGIRINSSGSTAKPGDVIEQAILGEIATPNLNINVATNDWFTIWTGGTEDNGFVILTSGDNASFGNSSGAEPIFVAQTRNNYETDPSGLSILDNAIAHLITLMDTSGNQSFNEVEALNPNTQQKEHVITSNTRGLSIRPCTQLEYDSIDTKDANTLYIITEE